MCQIGHHSHKLWRNGDDFVLRLIPYNRRAAVAYAHKWAFGRNPAFYDFSDLGGDCTNFLREIFEWSIILNFIESLGNKQIYKPLHFFKSSEFSQKINSSH